MKKEKKQNFVLSSSRRVSVRDIGRFFIPRTTTLRGDEREIKAFTLIELLVVVLIIGILSAVALPQYQKAVMKTRYAIMKPIVRHMYEAEKLYYLANGEYADTFDKLGVEIAGQTSDTKSLEFPWGFCTIESDYVYCYNYQLTMAYYINFNDERWCLTYDADKQYPLRHQICQADTGNTPTSSGNYQYL